MENKVNMTCIMCPMGCSLVVDRNGKEMKVSGNTCIRGEQYAKEELRAPKRMVTALVKTSFGVLPVKTSTPVPKDLVFKVVNEINKLNLKNAKMGDVIIKNILNTGANVVVTGNRVDYQL